VRRATPLDEEPLDLPGVDVIDKVTKGVYSGVPDADVVGATNAADLAAGQFNPVPKLPETLDQVVGFFLTIFPIIVLASWVNMNVVSYNKSKEAKEADEKRKIRRAIKVDEKELEELEELDKAPAKRRKKRTAFEEALALEEKAEARKSFRLDP